MTNRMRSSLDSTAAQLQAVQRAVRMRSQGSGWSLTNRGEERVLAKQAVRMERLVRRLLDDLITQGVIQAHANGVIRAKSEDATRPFAFHVQSLAR